MKKADTDELIMKKVSNGDLKAMSFLFEKYHIQIYNFLLRMVRDKELSEDLTQEVFFNIIKYKESYNGSNFTTWMYTIARNVISKEYRKKKLKIVGIENVEYKISNSQLDISEEILHLEDSIQRLSFEDREIIVLSKIEGMKYEELSKVLKTTVGALKTKNHRAMKKLKEIYFKNKTNERLQDNRK